MSTTMLMRATVLAVLSCGCSRNDMVSVAGRVTFDGAELPIGEITFLPEDATIAPAAGKILDGEYHLQSKPGKMRVKIEAYRKTEKRDDEGSVISECYIPPQFNKESELTVEVSTDGDNDFDFNLKE